MALLSGISRCRCLILASAAVWFGAATACAPLEKFYIGEDGDRPPVVVDGGSMTVTAEPDPRFHYPGFFSVERQGKRWAHQHPNQATIALDVSVTGSSGCPAAIRATEVDVTFDVGGDRKEITFEVDRGDLWIEADGKTVARDRAEPYVLRGGPATLTSVEIDDGPTCRFDGAARGVRIAQTRR